uniref:Uncharacterized protein n=1 Tax=Clastoptera arizonana TaxID=38151 RepID=A0A1B6CCY0_9HEMI
MILKYILYTTAVLVTLTAIIFGELDIKIREDILRLMADARNVSKLTKIIVFSSHPNRKEKFEAVKIQLALEAKWVRKLKAAWDNYGYDDAKKYHKLNKTILRLDNLKNFDNADPDVQVFEVVKAIEKIDEAREMIFSWQESYSFIP